MPGRRASAILLSNYFLLFVTYGVLTPYLPLYLRARGFTPSRIGVLLGVVEIAGLAGPLLVSRLSLYLQSSFRGNSAAFAGSGVSLMWALGAVAEIAPIWQSGRLIARWGLRLVLLVSLAAISLRLSLFVLAPSLGLIALAQLLHAFTFGTSHTAAVAYVNTKIPAEHRGLGMAVYTAIGIGLASFSASVAGGYIVESFGYRTLFVSYAVIPLAAIAVLFTKAGRAGILDPWKPRPF